MMRTFKQRLDGEVGGLISTISPTDVDCIVLSAGVASTYTIPDGVDCLLFYAHKDIYVRFNAAAVIPTGLITDGSAPMPNPGMIAIDSTDSTVSIISEYACNVYIYRWLR